MSNKRDFSNWLTTLTESISSWNFYTDFPKVFNNIKNYEKEISLLNSLIGSTNLEEELLSLLGTNPSVKKVLPLLLATRQESIYVLDDNRKIEIDFFNNESSDELLLKFMQNTGLFDLIKNSLVSNFKDYLIGIEVGLDSNARKNRTVLEMEKRVEEELQKIGLKLNVDYFKQMNLSSVENHFKLNLKNLKESMKAEKRFDFVIFHDNKHIYLLEVNFYTKPGSKLNEVARSYKMLAKEIESESNLHFVWITDGKGWFGAQNNLKETFEEIDTVFNLNDLSYGKLEELLNEFENSNI